MTALLTRSPGAARVRDPDWQPQREPAPDGPTLEDVVCRAWEVLRADVPAACPVCGGELIPRRSAETGARGGRCDSCGSALS